LDAEQPRFLVMAGPNGAGKSICASFFLPPSMPYINADEIAKTLATEQTRDAEIQAVRIALQLMDQAEANRESFATETTLASKTLASRAARLRSVSYFFHLVYLWTPSPDFSVHRVAKRVKLGGHDIPEDTIRRRWLAGSKNFFSLYRPIADLWDVVDNATSSTPRLIATGRLGEPDDIQDPVLWDDLCRRANDAT